MRPITLYRKVGSRIRYYRLAVHPTLFGEFLLEREFGSVTHLKPTGVHREYFTLLQDAEEALMEWLKVKRKKGYAFSMHIQGNTAAPAVPVLHETKTSLLAKKLLSA